MAAAANTAPLMSAVQPVYSSLHAPIPMQLAQTAGATQVVYQATAVGATPAAMYAAAGPLQIGLQLELGTAKSPHKDGEYMGPVNASGQPEGRGILHYHGGDAYQ